MSVFWLDQAMPKMPKPAPLIVHDLPIAALRDLVEELLGDVRALKQENAALRDEIGRLKGGSGRPNIKPGKPSGMEQASQGQMRSSAGKRPGRGKKTLSRVTIEDRVIQVEAPEGSRFKGYESFVVQDLVIHPSAVRFQRERWVTPDGRTIIASLPDGLDGHFGPALRRFILAQYHQGQVTVPRLVKLLEAIGIEISKRQVMRLLIEGQDRFLEEAHAVLRTGLETASWVTVDDTGARHKARNGFCTHIGNDHFAWFGTSASKSRLNFLNLLRAGHSDYTINTEALAYMRERGLAGSVIERLAGAEQKLFADSTDWHAHLAALGIDQLTGTNDPMRIATEGALWGSVKAHGLLPDTVIVSDDAGQFNVGRHSLCWVHTERLVHKLETFTETNRAIQKQMRRLIWRFYDSLQAYRRNPDPQRRSVLRSRFDRIFKRRTGFVSLDRLLARLHANKAELLMVLDYPQIPLHTNGSENDIRCQVTKRKISGGTRSDVGRDCRDAFLSLLKTCAKLGISFWDYLGDRLSAVGAKAVPSLPQIVAQRCAAG